MARIICYPVGNADCSLIDPTSRRPILIDFANRPADADGTDKRINLAEALDEELEEIGAKEFHVVVFTHLDLDHIRGAADYFEFEHSPKLSGGGRKKMKTMWVPAAVITEVLDKDNTTADHEAVQKEAQHRLKKGKGIRVISCPDDLAEWGGKNGVSTTNNPCIIHAGTIAPEYTLANDCVEFFIHAPASDAEDTSENLARNEASILLQATFAEGGTETRALFLSDAPHELLADVVVRSEKKKNLARLQWDIYHTPHHSSYLSVGPEKGKVETAPTKEVERLLEVYGQPGSLIITSSDKIPLTDEDQPPHKQADAYYAKVARKHNGKQYVTMEWPNSSKPTPMVITIDSTGYTIAKTATVAIPSIVASSAPRAGR